VKLEKMQLQSKQTSFPQVNVRIDYPKELPNVQLQPGSPRLLMQKLQTGHLIGGQHGLARFIKNNV